MCGIAHTNYEAYAIADNEDKDGAPEEYFNVRASEAIEVQAPFNFWCVAVCCSLHAVACIPRRSCPSLSRNQGRGAEIVTRPLSLGEKSGMRRVDGVEGSATLSDAVDAKIS